eukprot:13166071-Alexandrium_andersonii.AAC.1
MLELPTQPRACGERALMTWKLMQLTVARGRFPTLAERGLGKARRGGDGGGHRGPMRCLLYTSPSPRD